MCLKKKRVEITDRKSVIKNKKEIQEKNAVKFDSHLEKMLFDLANRHDDSIKNHKDCWLKLKKNYCNQFFI